MSHPRQVLEAEFASVDQALDEGVELWFIGGGAMSLQRLKDATKDLDCILQNEQDIQRLGAALEARGYTPVHDLDRAYQDLAATRIYAKEGAPQWDLFIQVVCRKLRLSPGMRQRAKAQDGSQHLRVHVLAPEDIFVFKAITERKADELDVDALWAHGLEWQVVLAEMRWQCENSDHAWSPSFLNALEQLEAKGRRVPILDDVAALVEGDLAEWAILSRLKGPRDAGELLNEIIAIEGGPALRAVLEAALDRLVERGRVRRRGSKVSGPRPGR